jgi:hypothetical protein
MIVKITKHVIEERKSVRHSVLDLSVLWVPDVRLKGMRKSASAYHLWKEMETSIANYVGKTTNRNSIFDSRFM